jgi:hypothetical protein
METTEFMMQLAKKLVDERKVAESTANAYVRTLYQLNGKAPYKNLTFLKNTEGVQKHLEGYADSTRRAVLGAVVGVLMLFKDKPTFKKIFTFYHDLMTEKNKVAREEEAKAPNTKTEKQKDNWLSWEDISRTRSVITKDVSEFSGNKTVTNSQYDRLLQSVILALYTEIQPRRNQDYLDMYIVKKWSDKMPTDKNYFDVSTGKFVFNKYKTSKKYGAQTAEVPAPLLAELQLFLKFHPLWKGVAKRKADPVKLLVQHDGTPLVAVNAITRILNRIFGKKIGSSMLRHIYISDKYKEADVIEQERKKDAEAMGHSVGMQKSVYFKKDEDEGDTITHA